RNFSLAQKKNKLIFQLRTSKTDRHGQTEMELLTLDDSGPTHLVLTYRSGEFHLYVDGERREAPELKGDFFNWDEAHQVLIGNEVNGRYSWQGTLHSFAILKRFLTEEQALARF
ncbi:MAG: LamG-like jellyroll fold domain-containing protein, partial [Verrucomicrobiota bacterium]